jgi:predicted NAD/FAD-dependent oxidoreductase
MERAVKSLFDEVNQISIDWSKHTLVSAGENVFNTMRALHPELSDSAIRALAWKFTFEWR